MNYDLMVECFPYWAAPLLLLKEGELEARIQEHQKWLAGQGGRRLKLRGRRFRGGLRVGKANLSYASFDSCDISGALFSQCIMSNTTFRNSRIMLTDFFGCDMTASSLKQVDACSANFSGSNLTHSLWDHAIIYGVHLDDTDMSGMEMNHCVGILRDHIKDITDPKDSRGEGDSVFMPLRKGKKNEDDTGDPCPRIQRQ